MRHDETWARARFAAARVARLATVSPAGAPRVVPVAFALVGAAAGDRIVSAVDHKPKSTSRLARLTDVEAEPRVSLLVDEYADEWSQLWWARADGRARVVPADAPEAADLLEALVARYPQYAAARPRGPLLVVDVARWSAWSAS